MYTKNCDFWGSLQWQKETANTCTSLLTQALMITEQNIVALVPPHIYSNRDLNKAVKRISHKEIKTVYLLWECSGNPHMKQFLHFAKDWSAQIPTM